MTLRIEEGANRHASLRNMTWKTRTPQPPPEVIPAGATVLVQVRGVYATDGQGGTIKIGEKDSAGMMISVLETTWATWVRPWSEKAEKEGVEIPPELHKITVLITKSGPVVRFNEGQVVQMRARRGLNVKKGDPILITDVLEISELTPPTHGGQAVPYVEVRFAREQIAIIFDFTRGEDPQPEWTAAERRWYTRAVFETMLTGAFGHLPIVVPKLRSMGIPFLLGPASSRLADITASIDKGASREEVDKMLAEVFGSDDWRDLLETWKQPSEWAKRQHLFDDAIKAYEVSAFGSAVVELMTQVEGVIMDFLLERGLGLDEKGYAKRWSDRLDELEKALSQDDVGPAAEAMRATTLDFLRKASLYEQFRWTRQAPPANRHAALHGADLTYPSKANAHRLWLTLGALHWMLTAAPMPSAKTVTIEKAEESGAGQGG